ncbi:MAG: type II secretion system protein [Verrucomicrobia bacterium]|nr:type II secretion system protein [Verrucomicrobiota bacterium]
MNMKSRTPSKFHSTAGMTLVEMLIVGAIICIVAGLLITAGSNAVRKSRISTTIGSIALAKTAITDYLTPESGANITIPLTEGANIPADGVAGANAGALGNAARLDDVLLAARSIDKPFSFPLSSSVPIPGTNPVIWNVGAGRFTAAAAPDTDYSNTARLECRPTAIAAAPSGGLGNFRIDGVSNLPQGRRVVYAVLPNVNIDAALSLSRALDKEPLSEVDITTNDERGMVVYVAPTNGDTTTVYVYVGVY